MCDNLSHLWMSVIETQSISIHSPDGWNKIALHESSLEIEPKEIKYEWGWGEHKFEIVSALLCLRFDTHSMQISVKKCFWGQRDLQVFLDKCRAVVERCEFGKSIRSSGRDFDVHATRFRRNDRRMLGNCWQGDRDVNDQFKNWNTEKMNRFELKCDSIWMRVSYCK